MTVKREELERTSFRLDKSLVERLRDATRRDRWPPPPTQTEIVARGIELVLAQLERKKQ